MAKKKDGKQLESIVTYIESLRLPPDWSITPRVLSSTTTGRPAAELDIMVEGKVGTIDFKWLIECRDRPSEGPAPVAWIEQLIGRRQRFNLSRVTAVSTTGFSTGALEEAERFAIDTREFKVLSPAEFEEWPELVGMPHRTEIRHLDRVEFGIEALPPTVSVESLNDVLEHDQANLMLRNLNTGALITPREVFTNTLGKHPELLTDLTPNGPAVPIQFNVTLNEPHALDTAEGPVPVVLLRCKGSVQWLEEHKPLVYSGEYSRSSNGETISRLRMFEPLDVLGLNLQMEIHESPDIPGSTVVFRNVTAAPRQGAKKGKTST
ncbi:MULTISPECIES: hypothetical protein [Pseudomonas]|uniref:Restriction endonuclease type IV Mrr domain-containing protein n=1 Tax=Pseudomonas fluorescens TaxID=294 RepID=A0A109KRY6_PSEFL|nr:MULTISPECIES: hypothetical protein [Pseudomonas]KAA6193745.1 hypothetical protein F3K52_18735 [Pseudomonas lactis]KWV74300.1 hypothetical protein PFL603g_03214 [Pseudomonas fluorescens]